MIRISHTFFATAFALATTVFLPQQPAEAKAFKVIYSFPAATDGAAPHAGLIQDSAGNLYGTTFYGGNTSEGRGVAYKIAPGGAETVLHNFSGGTDGGLPAGLMRDSSGNLYGTTEQGGVDGGCNSQGCGIVYKIDTSGTQTVLYTFSGFNDGAFPQAALIADKKGNLYSTTTGGGTTKNGTVFKLTAKGKEVVLHSFAGGSDGMSPIAGLIADKSGHMFGTTNLGGTGTGCGGFGCGTIYEIDAKGTETVLYSFTGGSDGGKPVGGLLMDKSGNLFGTTEFYGLNSGCGGTGCGTVFKLSSAGALTTLYTFTGGSDGGQPVASLASDSSGNLYGTTLFWGQGYGVIFALAPNGTENVLHSFTNGDDGAYPWGGLLMNKGYFISSGSGGGSRDFGNVFKVRK
ncbi:MAG TPA: choice-of-anchor tandem repeat GloVer-containing protein [Rhizomicrobium sp.]